VFLLASFTTRSSALPYLEINDHPWSMPRKEACSNPNLHAHIVTTLPRGVIILRLEIKLKNGGGIIAPDWVTSGGNTKS